jgi:sRNA-binding protein
VLRPAKVIVASPGVLATLQRLRPYLSAWPVVLPTRERPEIRPLAVGTGQALVAWLKSETDVEGAAIADEVLRLYTRSSAYLIALAQPSSQRFALDGSLAGSVEPKHRHFAAIILESRAAAKTRHADGEPAAPRRSQAKILRPTAKADVVAAGSSHSPLYPMGRSR